MSPLTDLDIIEKIRAGDTNSYAVLIERYRHLVFTSAVRIVKSREEAEEIAQDVFVNAFRSLDSFRGDCKFSTWLYRITYNRSMDHLKKESRRIPVESEDISESYDIGYLDGQMEAMEQQDRIELVKNAIEQLPGENGMLVTLFYLKELSLKEISEITGLKANSIKVQLHRSRKRLCTILRSKIEPEIIERHEGGTG